MPEFVFRESYCAHFLSYTFHLCHFVSFSVFLMRFYLPYQVLKVQTDNHYVS